MSEMRATAPAAHGARAGDLRLVREAILMVAAGGCQRVVLTGLADPVSVLDVACRMALESGVRIVPLWGHDDHLAMRVEGIRA